MINTVIHILFCHFFQALRHDLVVGALPVVHQVTQPFLLGECLDLAEHEFDWIELWARYG